MGGSIQTAGPLYLTLFLPFGSFRINDGNRNDHAINQEFDWSSVEK